jgi:FkbM family methyltransferase
MVLSRLFEEKSAGFYVDIGAHHPSRFSNSYLFYLKGWRGINVDAMPGSMKDFRRVRPRDCNIEALVSSRPGTRTYYLFNEPAINTCDDVLARARNGLAHFRLTGTKAIEAKSLAALLEKHLVTDQKIDFMSIDVEGLDLDVLQSNNWDKFVPTVILTEEYSVASLEAAFKSSTALFLRDRGYELFAKTVNTLFFKQQNAQISDDPLPQPNGHL